MPWLAGLLIGASAHVVWWTHQLREPVIERVEVPTSCEPAHVIVHARPRSTVADRAAAPPAPPPDRPSTADPTAGVRGAVVCSSRGCTIRRSFLTQLLDDPRMFSRYLFTSSIEPDGRPSLRVRGVYPGSVAAVLGLRDGDAIVALDDQPLGVEPEPSPWNDALSPRTGFTLTIRRDGTQQTMRYRIVDE